MVHGLDEWHPGQSMAVDVQVLFYSKDSKSETSVTFLDHYCAWKLLTKLSLKWQILLILAPTASVASPRDSCSLGWLPLVPPTQTPGSALA